MYAYKERKPRCNSIIKTRKYDQIRFKNQTLDKPFKIGYKCVLSDSFLVTPHTVGELQNKCDHCSALYFSSERNTSGSFSLCCANGRVSVGMCIYQALHCIHTLHIYKAVRYIMEFVST